MQYKKHFRLSVLFFSIVLAGVLSSNSQAQSRNPPTLNSVESDDNAHVLVAIFESKDEDHSNSICLVKFDEPTRSFSRLTKEIEQEGEVIYADLQAKIFLTRTRGGFEGPGMTKVVSFQGETVWSTQNGGSCTSEPRTHHIDRKTRSVNVGGSVYELATGKQVPDSKVAWNKAQSLSFNTEPEIERFSTDNLRLFRDQGALFAQRKNTSTAIRLTERNKGRWIHVSASHIIVQQLGSDSEDNSRRLSPSGTLTVFNKSSLKKAWEHELDPSSCFFDVIQLPNDQLGLFSIKTSDLNALGDRVSDSTESPGDSLAMLKEFKAKLEIFDAKSGETISTQALTSDQLNGDYLGNNLYALRNKIVRLPGYEVLAEFK